MTWYTPDVKRALEIVPVELTQGYARFRLRPEKTWWVFESWGAKNQRWYIAGHPTDYEVQALIEKALREWLEERHIYLVRDGKRWFCAKERKGVSRKLMCQSGRMRSASDLVINDGIWEHEGPWIAAVAAAAVLATKGGES